MRIKFSLTDLMGSIGSAAPIFILLSFPLVVVGCSGSGVSDVALRAKSLENFNAGREVEAVSLAKKIDNADESNFLLTQYIIYDTFKYNHDLDMINKKWYNGIVNLDLSKVTPELRMEYIASQIFSEVRLDSRGGALSQLSNRCKAWVAPDAATCLKKIITSVRNSYISKPSRMGALYLLEAVDAGNTLKMIDSKAYGYYVGLAFANIDKNRSVGMLNYLVRHDWLDDNTKKVYCSILNSQDPDVIKLCAAAGPGGLSI